MHGLMLSQVAYHYNNVVCYVINSYNKVACDKCRVNKNCLSFS